MWLHLRAISTTRNWGVPLEPENGWVLDKFSCQPIQFWGCDLLHSKAIYGHHLGSNMSNMFQLRVPLSVDLEWMAISCCSPWGCDKNDQKEANDLARWEVSSGMPAAIGNLSIVMDLVDFIDTWHHWHLASCYCVLDRMSQLWCVDDPNMMSDDVRMMLLAGHVYSSKKDRFCRSIGL